LNRGDAEDAEGGKGERVRNATGIELDALAGRVIGSAIEVHRHLGPGFLEAVDEEALAVEFRLRDVPFARQKAIAALAPIHKAQVISYLKATRLHLGLLINFNVPVLKDGLQRIILS